jgi:hypothetical protein
LWVRPGPLVPSKRSEWARGWHAAPTTGHTGEPPLPGISRTSTTGHTVAPPGLSIRVHISDPVPFETALPTERVMQQGRAAPHLSYWICHERSFLDMRGCCTASLPQACSRPGWQPRSSRARLGWRSRFRGRQRVFGARSAMLALCRCSRASPRLGTFPRPCPLASSCLLARTLPRGRSRTRLRVSARAAGGCV